MTHETLIHQPHKETPPQPEYVLIEASIEALDQEANLAWEIMDDAYESAPEEAKKRIDCFQEDFDTATSLAREKGEPIPTLSSFIEMAGDLPEEYKAGILAYELVVESVVTKAESAEKELEKYAPEKAAVVVEKARQIEASLDYDKLVAEAFEDDDRTEPFEEGIRYSSINLLYEVSKLIAVRKLLESSATLPYHRLKSVEYSLTEYEQDWRERGLLKGESDEAAETPAVTLSATQITGIEAHINEVDDIRTKYKKFDDVIRKKTQAVLSLAGRYNETEEPPQNLDNIFTDISIVYNEQLEAALSRRFVQKLSELPADEFETDIDSQGYSSLVEQARNIDVVEALKRLEVIGSFENLPFEFTKAELKFFLLTSVPANALASVKRIHFRPMTKEEDEEDNTAGLHKWSEELNGSEIIISDTKVRKHYEYTLDLLGDYENAEEMAVLSAKNRMLHVITHEFGHALHHVLPVAALKRWEEQRSTDPTNVTDYVKYRHDSKHHQRFMEDFADTMALFINHPEELIITSPVRFNAMRKIFEEFMPFYADVTQKLQDRRITTDRMIRASKGMSDEDTKNMYLSHETDLHI